MDVKNSVLCSQIGVRSQDVDTLQPEMILQFGIQIIGGGKPSDHEYSLYVKL